MILKIISLEVVPIFCKYCGKTLDDDSAFCSACGKPVTPVNTAPSIPPVSVETPAIQPVPVSPDAPPPCQAPGLPFPPAPAYQMTPPPVNPVAFRKGTLKVPALILGVMGILGLILYFLIPFGSSDPEPAVSQPDYYLTVTDHAVRFHEELYHGESELTLPAELDGMEITAIDEGGFRDCDDLTTVILPDTLVTIRSQAFYGCDSLRGIFIPEGVATIEEEAFSGCTALEAICIPNSARSIHFSAFDRCLNLRHVFFSGTTEEWEDLFRGQLSKNCTVYCSDGEVSYN